MNCKLLQTLALGLCIMALFCASNADGREGKFLVISDLHFNPCNGLNANEFKELSQAPVDEWPSFFDRLKQPVVPLGSDSNYSLLVSAVTAAAKRLENPDFILCPGDFLAHDWQSKYSALAPESIASNPQAYQDFTAKSIQFIAHEFRKRFPSAVILPALGNADSFCQDYWIQPNGAFLKRFASVWKPLLGTAVDPVAFDRSFSSLGCYVADIPGLASHRLIVVDSVLWSKSYCSSYHDPGNNNCCGCTNPGATPGIAAFAWLEKALSQSAQEKKTVWLLMHVPPGLDSYKEEGASGKSAAASLWTEDFLARYLKLIDKYRLILQISFAGHTHMDDFRVDSIKGEPVLLHKIIPAVSPVFGSNPAFQVYRYEKETGALIDWQTHFFSLALPGRSKPTQTWSMEYDAQDAYRLPAINAKTVSALFNRIRNNPTGQEAGNYRTFYAVSAKSIPESHLVIYACAVLSATYVEYGACVSGHNIPLPVEMENPAKLRRMAGGLGAPKP